MIRLSDFDVSRKETTLSSGTRLVTFEKKGLPIYIEVLFRSGSRYDPIGKEGLAHFTEHMIVAGSKNYPSQEKLSTFIERLGGAYGASTSAEVVTISVAVGDPNDIGAVAVLIHEMLDEALFETESIENERKAILKELGDKKGNPEDYIWELYKRLFFQETSVGRSIIGNEQTISDITRVDLINYYRNSLVSGRMGIVAGGEVDINKTADEIEKHLKIKSSPKPDFDKKLPEFRNKTTLSHIYPGIDQIQIIIGFRTVSETHPDAPILDMIASISGGSRASSLLRKLRYETGLVYGVSAFSVAGSDHGTWGVITSTTSNKVNEVLTILSTEFKRIYEGGITQEELSFAKDRIIKSKRRYMQTSSSWVLFHSFGELIDPKNYLRLDAYLNTIEKVTLEDITRVGEKYIKPSKWYLATTGDISEADLKMDY